MTHITGNKKLWGMVRYTFIIFLLLTSASCRQSPPLTGQEKTGIIKEVRHTLHDYYADISKTGLMAEFKYLDSSNEFFWVPPGYSGPISYDSVAAVLKQNAPKYKSIVNNFDTLQIIPLSKELATYSGRLKSVMTDTAGKTVAFLLVETGILIKRKEGWKLLSGQTALLNQ